MRLALTGVFSVVLGLAAVGCGVASPSAPADAAATSSPMPSMTGPPPASSASPTLGAGIASAGDITFEMPPRWRQVPIADIRAQLIAFGDRLTGPERGYFDWAIQAIDSGRTRMAAAGPTKGATGSILLSVEERADASLPEAAERLFKEQSPFTEPNGMTRATVVSLPIGPAVRLAETHQPPVSMPTAIPSRTVQYVTRFRDGRTIWILGTAPASDDSFEEVMTRVAETLAVS